MTFWLLYLWTLRTFGDHLVARGAALLLTVYPNNIAYAPLVLTEYLYTALLLLVSVLLLRPHSNARLATAGFVFGLGTLVKTQTLLLVPALVVIACCSAWSLRGVVATTLKAMIAVVVTLLVLVPWTVRNYLELGAFVPVSTNGGMALLAGNNPSVVGDYWRDYNDSNPLFEGVRFSVADQVEANRRAGGIARQWILDNPTQFLALVPKKVFRLWAPDGEAEWQYQAGTPWYDQFALWFRLIRVLNQVFFTVILILCLLALRRLLRSAAPPYMWFGMGVAALFTAISIIFSGQSRYHFPAMPFLLAYAAWVVFTPRQRHPAENGSAS